MARLPITGSDAGAWGAILNEYLAVELSSDGSLKRTGQPNGLATLDGNSKLSQSVDAGKINSGTLDAARIPDLSTLYLPISKAVTLQIYDGSTDHYKLLLTSSGAVTAVPFNTDPPNAPTNVANSVRLAFVTLTWNAVSDAVSYRINRNGALLTTLTSTKYLDESITVGTTYSYTVIAVNQYGMWSQPSTASSAYIDPALDQAPVIDKITLWPSNPRPNEKVYIHVNSSDVDAQTLATTLQVSAGSLTATFDPTTWIWQGA